MLSILPSSRRLLRAFLAFGGLRFPVTARRHRLQTPVGLDLAIAKGWLWLHESGTYVKFTDAGAQLFA